MKKKKKNNYQGRYFIIICVYLFMLFAKANAQNPEIAITADNFYLGSLNQFSAGFMLRVPVAERFTLNYKLASGYKPDGFIYVHANTGWLVYGQLVSYVPDMKAVTWLAILTAIVPEGVGCYADEDRNYHIAVNPLGFDYWHKKEPYEESVKLSGTIQFSAKLPAFKNFPMCVSPYAAATMLYKSDAVLSRYGFHFGIMLSPERKPPEYYEN